MPVTETLWIECPVCGGPDMECEVYGERELLICCTNHECASNGGGNHSAIDDTAQQRDEWAGQQTDFLWDMISWLDNGAARPQTHSPLQELAVRAVEAKLHGSTVKLDAVKQALRQIAFHTPVVCYEHDDRRYTNIEDVYRLKQIAAQARDNLEK